MKTRHVESLEEMVFKNRNKLYGAYSLHRKYKNHVIIALILAIILLFSVVAFPLISAYMNKGKQIKGPVVVINDTISAPPPDNPVPPPPPPPEPVLPEARIRFTIPRVTDSVLTDENFGKQDLLAQMPNTELPPPDDLGRDIDTPKKTTIDQKIVEPPVTWVEEFPQFPGGEQALYTFLAETLRYPPIARENNITGTVYLTFVVEKNGSISDIKVLRGVEGGCTEEAIRVVKTMPTWSPGRHNGTPVRFQYNLPVKFTLL